MGDAEFPVPDVPVHVYVVVSLVVVSLLLNQMLGLWLTGFDKPGQGATAVTAAEGGSSIIDEGHYNSWRSHRRGHGHSHSHSHGRGGLAGLNLGNENEKLGDLKEGNDDENDDADDDNDNKSDNLSEDKEKETEVAQTGSGTTTVIVGGGGRVRGVE